MRFFEEEEAAYFCRFGVLAAEAPRKCMTLRDPGDISAPENQSQLILRRIGSPAVNQLDLALSTSVTKVNFLTGTLRFVC